MRCRPGFPVPGSSCLMRSHCITVRTATTASVNLGPQHRSQLRHRSGTNETRDGSRCLGKLLVGVAATLGDGAGHAVIEVLVEQVQRHRPQRTVHGADLGKDVDAVLVFLDHPRDATHLTLDAPQPLGVIVFLLRIAVCSRHLGPSSPSRYASDLILYPCWVSPAYLQRADPAHT